MFCGEKWRYCTYTRTQHEGHTAPLHQMTASAIGNMPEGNIDSFKATLARHVQHADEHLFKFKVMSWSASN